MIKRHLRISLHVPLRIFSPFYRCHFFRLLLGYRVIYAAHLFFSYLFSAPSWVSIRRRLFFLASVHLCVCTSSHSSLSGTARCSNHNNEWLLILEPHSDHQATGLRLSVVLVTSTSSSQIVYFVSFAPSGRKFVHFFCAYVQAYIWKLSQLVAHLCVCLCVCITTRVRWCMACASPLTRLTLWGRWFKFVLLWKSNFMNGTVVNPDRDSKYTEKVLCQEHGAGCSCWKHERAKEKCKWE